MPSGTYRLPMAGRSNSMKYIYEKNHCCIFLPFFKFCQEKMRKCNKILFWPENSMHSLAGKNTQQARTLFISPHPETDQCTNPVPIFPPYYHANIWLELNTMTCKLIIWIEFCYKSSLKCLHDMTFGPIHGENKIRPQPIKNLTQFFFLILG